MLRIRAAAGPSSTRQIRPPISLSPFLDLCRLRSFAAPGHPRLLLSYSIHHASGGHRLLRIVSPAEALPPLLTRQGQSPQCPLPAAWRAWYGPRAFRRAHLLSPVSAEDSSQSLPPPAQACASWGALRGPVRDSLYDAEPWGGSLGRSAPAAVTTELERIPSLWCWFMPLPCPGPGTPDPAATAQLWTQLRRAAAP